MIKANETTFIAKTKYEKKKEEKKRERKKHSEN